MQANNFSTATDGDRTCFPPGVNKCLPPIASPLTISALTGLLAIGSVAVHSRLPHFAHFCACIHNVLLSTALLLALSAFPGLLAAGAVAVHSRVLHHSGQLRTPAHQRAQGHSNTCGAGSAEYEFCVGSSSRGLQPQIKVLQGTGLAGELMFCSIKFCWGGQSRQPDTASCKTKC